MVWPQIAMLVVSLAISYLARPKAKSPKPAGLSDFTVPTAESGREAGVLFGTKIIRGPNVVFYAGLTVKAIKKKP